MVCRKKVAQFHFLLFILILTVKPVALISLHLSHVLAMCFLLPPFVDAITPKCSGKIVLGHFVAVQDFAQSAHVVSFGTGDAGVGTLPSEVGL